MIKIGGFPIVLNCVRLALLQKQCKKGGVASRFKWLQFYYCRYGEKYDRILFTGERVKQMFESVMCLHPKVVMGYYVIMYTIFAVDNHI